MKGSEFLATFRGRDAYAWERAIVDMARSGDPSLVRWPMRTLLVSGGGHELQLDVASDVVAIGEGDDVLRIPLLPTNAQAVADAFGMVLPTPKLARKIAQAADVVLEPESRDVPLAMQPNKGPNLDQYAQQNAAIERQLGGRRGLVTGHKKDIVVGDAMHAGKVVIYLWRRGDVPDVDPFPMTEAAWRIQPLSSLHGDQYVDYSHGVRLISRACLLDGQPDDLVRVATDPSLALLVSDSGALGLGQLRYGPNPFPPYGSSRTYMPTGLRGLNVLGLTTIEDHQALLRARRKSA